MPEIKFYNTLTRNLEPFVPRYEGEVRMYVCGPTTYDIAHVGNARPAIVFDVLARHLRARGYRVTYVRNITDVDDKIVARANQNGEQPTALSARFAPIYQADMRALGCSDPTREPKVSEHIPEIIALVQRLIQNGHAYEVTMPNGARDVYFAVRSFPGYGKLSRRNIDELLVGARIEQDDNKRDPLDFALWKGCTDQEWGWPSPWATGRPGWHIECSAMSEKYLGFGFDIHGGGMDLIFPHHENEIAQSEAATAEDGPFARIWMHNGFLNINKEKMSKSLGNFVRPCDVYVSNDPEALRYAYLSAHYRGPMSFDIDKLDDGRVVYPGVDEAERRIDYFFATLARLDAAACEGDWGPRIADLDPFRETILGARERVAAALDDDLNTPVALAHVGELAKAANELCDLIAKRKKDPKLVAEGGKLARAAAEALRSSTDVLGLLMTAAPVYAERTRQRRLASRGLDSDQIEAKLALRAAARKNKDFASADAIRRELFDKGVDIEDTPAASRWNVRI
jgi:cysteinyl-tRNA synthetase